MHGSRFTGQQGVQGTRNALDFRVSLAGCQTQISHKLGCISVEDAVADYEIKTLPLPMGIEREDTCMKSGLQAGMPSKAPEMRWIWGQSGLLPDSDFKGTRVR